MSNNRASRINVVFKQLTGWLLHYKVHDQIIVKHSLPRPFPLSDQMPSRSTLLSNFPVLRTSDPEYARDRLFTVFGAHSFDITPDDSRFAVRADHLQMRDIALSFCDYACGVAIGFGEASYVRQIFNVDGTGQYKCANRSAEITRGSCTPVLAQHTPLTLEFKARYRQLVLRIEFDALLRNLCALLGQEVSKPLIFDETEVRNPAMGSLRRMLFCFASDYNARGAFFSDVAAAEVERMVVMNFLMCHRHSYTDLLLREPLSSTSSAVRIVEEFIEANWDKPLDVPTMSMVAKVSSRSLFRQFKKDRGYTPADFSKRIRLNHAREMLEQPVEGTSVTQISFKCGFQNPGHFARDFRLAFGELPSEALKRSS